jgi:hypothetical protein
MKFDPERFVVHESPDFARRLAGTERTLFCDVVSDAPAAVR